ncbi:hypothetical protein [Roseimaritima ulvae]|uniref:Uncharacterized protein n=1 Tax=Roseimaritima ulvae TaxID=980254 RepID=A0A5B9R2V0_9BACT|nr:hypothetical protein [Roseimaritima ulvae]QEG40611.1 hypothetical protein UC8_26270 [Roseimaritima ulvae]
MTIAAKMNRLALCGTLAWLSLGTAATLSADEGWAPLHIATGPSAHDAPRQAAPAPSVRTVAYDADAPTIRRPTKIVDDAPSNVELLPVFEPPLAAPEEGGKPCHCDRCTSPSPRRAPVRKHAPHKPALKNPDCLVYNVLDGVAGGIEHALQLKTPQERSRRSVIHRTSCGCELCSQAPAKKRRRAKPASPMLKRLPSRTSTDFPMPPTVPMQVDAPLVDPPSEPLSHPIEELEPKPKTVPRLPAPIVPDELADPFEDDQAWRPGKNPAIKRSAYYE